MGVSVRKLIDMSTDGDRLVRSALNELIEKGIKVNILNIGIMDNTPASKLIRNIFFSFAEFERDMIVERTQEGKAIARTKEGFKEGRPKKYNEKLWSGHWEHSKLVIENGQIFINGYKDDTCWIINKLKCLSSSGIQNYSNSVDAWLDSPDSGVDCDEKKAALRQMYENSKVALIYGSAGTGKSTLINHDRSSGCYLQL